MAAAEAVVLHMNEPEPDSGTQLEGSENASSGSNEENNGETSPVAHALNTNYDSSDGAIPVSCFFVRLSLSLSLSPLQVFHGLENLKATSFPRPLPRRPRPLTFALATC